MSDAPHDLGPATGPSWPDDPAEAARAYGHGLDVLAAAARIVLLVDVAPMLAHLSRVEALAPVLDPTGYLRGGDDRLRDQRELLEAAAAFRAALERLRARLPAEVRTW